MADGTRTSQALDARAIGDALRVSKRAVIKRAAGENWPFSETRVSGGMRRYYAIDSLPADVRSTIARATAMRAAETAPASTAEAAGRNTARKIGIAEAVDSAQRQRVREQGQAQAAAVTGKARERMEAKLDLLARLREFAGARGIGICAAMEEFCDAYNSGALQVDLSVRRHTGADLHPATLRTWRRKVQQNGPVALAGDYGNRKGSGSIDSDADLRDFIVGVLREKPHISAKTMHDAIRARLPERLPVIRTLERWLVNWKRDNAELFMAVTNPDAWKNTYMPAFGNASEDITRINQLWMADTTPADLLLTDGRYQLLGVIDVATRRFKLQVCRTSTGEAVCQTFRHCMLEWGVPDAVKMDNGKDYASKRVAAMLLAVNVEPKFSTKFSPWEKPHIERAFRTFSHGLLEILPGYIGHNVAEAQAIRARQSFAEQLFTKGATVEIRMSAAELQAFCDKWTNDLYEHAPHGGLDEDTPWQRIAAQRGLVRVVGDARALDLLLGAGEMRTVGKKGIPLNKLMYIAPELGGVIGEQVLVRQDNEDLGRIVVYHADRFLCVAECPQVTGVSQREIAAEVRARKTKVLQDAKREMKALGRKAKVAELAQDILDERARARASLTSLPNTNVVELVTPALQAASDAADAIERMEQDRARGYDSAAVKDSIVQMVRDEQQADEDGDARFKWALDAMLAGNLNDIDARRLRNYQDTPEFLARWDFFTEFGAGTFGLADSYNALLPADALFNQGGN